jgi:RNA-directed DNA polymerase
MHVVHIPKRSGGSRTIYVPSHNEKPKYQVLVSQIARRARQLDRAGVMHGFISGRSPVTNARAHIGHAWTVSFDLADFFDHVTADRLKGKLPAVVIETVIVEGVARQGLPTSPAAANVAAADLDNAILKWIDKRQKGIVYTRYADDLTFSGDAESARLATLVMVPQIVKRCGWKLREDKTHVQLARHGRRHICGVAVDDQGVHPTRAMKRKLRAAEHHARVKSGQDQVSAKHHAAGLREWCRLRPPRERRLEQDLERDELQRLGKVWRLSIPKSFPDRSPDVVDGSLLITSDPVYILGCSTWTTGWTSCLRQPDGQYRRGAVWWTQAPGTRLAALLSIKDMEIAGVTRRQMRARTWVHTFRNGMQAHDRVYGDPESSVELVALLRSHGVLSLSDIPKGERTVGHVVGGKMPYLDNLHAVKMISGSRRKVVVLRR